MRLNHRSSRDHLPDGGHPVLALEPTKGSMLALLLVVPRLVCHGAFGALQISSSSPLLGNLLSLHLH